jgi:anti-anti-sigma factor
MGGNVELTVRSARQHVVVVVSGAVVPRTAATLRECLLRVLNTAPPYVVLDITGVDRMEPAGLAAIAEAHRGARLLGGWVRLVCPEHRARELMEAGVLPMVPRYDTVEDSVAAERRTRSRPRLLVGSRRGGL